VSRYQKGKTNLDFTEERDSEWQWHQLGYVQVRTSLQTDNHASTPPLSFFKRPDPSCRPTNSVKALKARTTDVKKRFLTFFLFWSRFFTSLYVFYFPNVFFFIFKKTLAKFGAASRLTRSTFKITATK